MKTKVTYLSVEYYPPLKRGTVHIMRQHGNIRTYVADRHDEHSISMSSVKRAMRVQTAMLEANA